MPAARERAHVYPAARATLYCGLQADAGAYDEHVRMAVCHRVVFNQAAWREVALCGPLDRGLSGLKWPEGRSRLFTERWQRSWAAEPDRV